MLESYSPIEWLLKTIRYWWIVTGFMIAGGLGGFYAHATQPDIFESSAVISVGIDYSRAGLLTDVEEDQIVEIVGDVIYSTDVLNRVFVNASDELPEARLRLQENAFVERKNFRWILRVRAEERDEAARLVNIWAEEALNELETAYSHALIADGYVGYLDSLVSCLEQSVALDSGQVFCSTANLAYVQDEIRRVSRELTDEKVASKGIFPGVLFSVTSFGEPPTEAINANKNAYVLGGSVIGFLASMFVVFSFSRKER